MKKISSVLNKRGLAVLPNALEALKSQQTKKSDVAFLGDWAAGLAVIGTPPTLTSLGDGTGRPVTTFWRPGVVEAIAHGSPTSEQCHEFYSSQIDGQSGGFGACIMAESTGHTFEIAIDAAQSMCRLAKIPEVPSSNLRIISGRKSIPDGDIRKIFVPDKSSRLVKLNIDKGAKEPGSIKTFRMFARIPSESANDAANVVYRAELYFCGDNQATPFGYNSIEVTNSGLLKIVNKSTGDPFTGTSTNTVAISGQLAPEGSSLRWDLAEVRRGAVQFQGVFDGQPRAHKAAFQIFPDTLEMKRVNLFGTFVRKEFITAAFTAQNALDVRFLAGGFKVNDGSNRIFSSATEFRTPIYAAAPGSEFRQIAEDIDFAADPFYSSPPAFSVDLRRFNCRAQPTVELSMIRDAKSEAVMRPCFTQRLDNMNFCVATPLIEAARERYPQVCTGP